MLGYLISFLTSLILSPFKRARSDDVSAEDVTLSKNENLETDDVQVSSTTRRRRTLCEGFEIIDDGNSTPTNVGQDPTSKYEVLDCHNVMLTTYKPEDFDNFLSFVKKYDQTYTYEIKPREKRDKRNPKIALLFSRMEPNKNYKMYTVRYDDQSLKCLVVMDPSKSCQHIVIFK